MNYAHTLLILLAGLLLAACGGQPTADDPYAPRSEGAATDVAQLVTVGLDWTPNTNHTGLYVAQDQGYFAANGLDVEIVQAYESGSVEQLVAAGQLDFGISYQEGVTQARAEGLPIVSVAAIIQHNTSGFASRAEERISTPADFAGKVYGGFGSPTEEAILRGLMECVGADFSAVEIVDIGTSDFFVATERGDIDFAWVFQGWTGIEAEVREVPLNIVMVNDIKNCVPDYYTPVLITSESTIAERPDIVRRFVAAVSAGYTFAIASPDEAATMLLAAVPELDADLVRQSQQYLAAQYQADAPRWGEQTQERWQTYAEWMAERNLIPEMIEAEAAFTNEFLPPAEE
ncbi:MAG: ABC transporter substrate-binding protein [Chloroflexaceae bacterium]|nr:ABC transporter substrate-binding protein [Chloroflexaceae bacterium]